jgi:hypothetical protein
VLLYPAAAGTAQKGILWGFDHWEGACAGQGYPCALSMTGSRSTKAVFVRIDP